MRYVNTAGINIVDTPSRPWDDGGRECAPGSIRGLFDLLISPALAGSSVGMITAFLDESGTHGPKSKITVMGGYCGRTEQWMQFEKDWSNAHGDQVFHAKEFCRRPDSERDSLVTKSVEILQQNGIFGLIAGIKNDDYRRYRSEFGKDIKRMESADGLCFMACLTKLAFTAEELWPTETISFVVEDGHKNVGDANRIFIETKQLHSGRWYHLGRFATASKSDYRALQAADLFSYETHCYLDRKIAGTAATRKSYFLELAAIPTLSSGYTWDTLRETGTSCRRILEEYKEAGGRPAGRALYRAPSGDLAEEDLTRFQRMIRKDVDDLLKMEDDESE